MLLVSTRNDSKSVPGTWVSNRHNLGIGVVAAFALVCVTLCFCKKCFCKKRKKKKDQKLKTQIDMQAVKLRIIKYILRYKTTEKCLSERLNDDKK